jgi:hypothetical protein
MALNTAGPLFGRIVKVVFPGPILAGHMATVAECISIHIHFATVRFMTILTYDPGFIHLALKEGGVHIYLILNLSIREIEILVKQGGPVGIQKGTSMVVVFGGNSPSGMAPGAHLYQLV